MFAVKNGENSPHPLLVDVPVPKAENHATKVLLKPAFPEAAITHIGGGGRNLHGRSSIFALVQENAASGAASPDGGRSAAGANRATP